MSSLDIVSIVIAIFAVVVAATALGKADRAIADLEFEKIDRGRTCKIVGHISNFLTSQQEMNKNLQSQIKLQQEQITILKNFVQLQASIK